MELYCMNCILDTPMEKTEYIYGDRYYCPQCGHGILIRNGCSACQEIVNQVKESLINQAQENKHDNIPLLDKLRGGSSKR